MKHNNVLTSRPCFDPLADAHITDDMSVGYRGRASNIALAVLVVLLYGTVSAERRSGTSSCCCRLFAAGMPSSNMRGHITARSPSHRRLLLRLDTLGARRHGGFTFILSAARLWSPQWASPAWEHNVKLIICQEEHGTTY